MRIATAKKNPWPPVIGNWLSGGSAELMDCWPQLTARPKNIIASSAAQNITRTRFICRVTDNIRVVFRLTNVALLIDPAAAPLRPKEQITEEVSNLKIFNGNDIIGIDMDGYGLLDQLNLDDDMVMTGVSK